MKNKVQINTLSNTCPYSGGTAVYKARTLNALYHPNAQYNDKVLCVPQGLNKNSSNNFNSLLDLDTLDEANLLKEQNVTNYLNQIIIDAPIIKQDININKSDAILAPLLTPNPSNGSITIIYNSAVNGQLHIYNMQGQLIENMYLQAGNNRIETQLQNIVSGIYNYKFIFNNDITNGKLTIIK
jgi:Secretion system C-terminal sorting domain